MPTRSSTSDVLTLANSISSTGAQVKQFWPDQFGHIQSFKNWSVQTNGSATSATINIDASLDGVNWDTSANAATYTSGTTKITAITLTAAAPYIRSNISAVSGGNVTIQAIGVS